MFVMKTIKHFITYAKFEYRLKGWRVYVTPKYMFSDTCLHKRKSKQTETSWFKLSTVLSTKITMSIYKLDTFLTVKMFRYFPSIIHYGRRRIKHLLHRKVNTEKKLV